MLFTGLIIFLSCLSVLGQKDCILKKDDDSIKVYLCAAEQIKFKSIKATFTVQATLSQLAAFVLDVSFYNSWQYKTIHARKVKMISEQELIYYTEIIAPWPVSNRDMVVNLRLVQDPETKVVTIFANSVPELLPANKDIVRVPMSRASWTVVPVSTNLLKVEYVMQIDPGGLVPAWMVNMVAAQAPYDSFKNLKDKIGQRKSLHAAFIVD